MKLRPELTPPRLSEALVARLTLLSEEIDCGEVVQSQPLVDAFNREANTRLGFDDFQGIYGGQGHSTWVRKILSSPYQRRIEDISRAELIEMTRRVMEVDGEEHEIDFWLAMLEINTPNDRISDLIFWPNGYFGDPNYSEELSAEQVVEIASQNDSDE